MSETRHLPELSERVETGVIQFGSDWPGVFIRGDGALWYGYKLKKLLAEMGPQDPANKMGDTMDRALLRRLADLLLSCDADPTTAEGES